VTDAQLLCNLFFKIVDIVGAQNVIHLVTDNGSNFKADGRLLNEKYGNICWSLCAAHCLNLILQDISKMPHVVDLAQCKSHVTKFLYNHKWPLGWLRERAGWMEILRPGETRFATTFIALKSLHDHKLDLQAMVTSYEFHGWRPSRSIRGKIAKKIILDSKFWNDCLVIVKIVGPLMRLLRVVDSNEKPALGYVYEEMYRARKIAKEISETRRGCITLTLAL